MHGTEYEFHYSRYPALRAYIDRIGAEQKNFRRFVVRKQDDGSRYYRDIAVIWIDPDTKEPFCKSDIDELKPTDIETAVIKAELAAVAFPKSCNATWDEVDLLKQSGQVTGTLFVIPVVNKRDEVRMCHERRVNPRTGETFYLPWTYFTSDRWLQMEPDPGELPFWKPRQIRNKASVMVHEGAKAAAFIDDLLNNPARREERESHPWAEELSDYEHWGTIGGAYATYRCDFTSLHRAGILG